MRWSTARKRLHVKVRPLKLEGLEDCNVVKDGERRRGERLVALKMKWKGPKSGLVPFRRVSTCQRNYTSQKLYKGGSIEWDEEEFESVCDFSVSSSKDNNSISLAPWDVTFNVLHGEDGDSKTKLAVVGGVSLNIAELALELDSEIEQRLPVSLQIDGLPGQAWLVIRVIFADVRTFDEMQQRTVQSFGEAKETEPDDEPCCPDDQSDGSSVINSDGLPEGPKSCNTRDKVGLPSWRKRLMSFRSSKRKREQLVNDKNANSSNAEINSGFTKKDEIRMTRSWEERELTSRDGKAKLKANMFLASFDQRSERAAGESACTALVVVIAHWLHSNRALMPTRLQFDSLITEGSSEWRRLCNEEAYANCFADNHFDLETVLRADLRPVTVLPDKSYTGIFSPEKFENLKEAMSFDDVWKKISSKDEECEERIYIVSWNDHFFVLKVEANACYLIDSLGERLFEGCNQAYILKFDDSSFMYEKMAKEDPGSDETAGAKGDKDEEPDEVIVCRGKDCCREFMKRFFAAISVSELEEEEKKGTASTYSLLQRLQIDFHCCSYSSAFSSSSSLTSLASSIFSSDNGF